MTDDEPERVILRLRFLGRAEMEGMRQEWVSWHKRLRQVLKTLLRAYGLRCVEIGYTDARYFRVMRGDGEGI